jgi:hypothetical protein
VPAISLICTQLEGTLDGLYLMLGGCMYLMIVAGLHAGVFHFDKERDRSRRRRWWDRKD